MTCEEYRTHLNALINNESLEVAQDREAHRVSCVACAEYAAQIVAIHALLRDIPAEPAPLSLTHSLRSIPASTWTFKTLQAEILRAALMLLPPLGLLILQNFLSEPIVLILQIGVILFGLVTWSISVLRPFFLASR